MSQRSRARVRRAGAVAVAGALALSGAAVGPAASPASALEGFALERLQGSDRYDTTASIARDAYASADSVVLASGAPGRFADALTGNYLAGEVEGPILLTAPRALPEATRLALAALDVTTVYIVGGPVAVSVDVEQALRDAGYAVERIGGADRYATAELVARRVGTDAANIGTVDGARTAILGNGQNFPDILAAGPLSASEQFPLTLTPPDALPEATRRVLWDLSIRRVLVVGGTSAVSAAVEQELVGMGIAVTRLQGADRFATATRIADYAYDERGYNREHVNLARSDDFADALAGGPHAAKARTPIVLTAPTSLSEATRAFLTSHRVTLATGHVFGGFGAVAAAVQAEAEEAAAGPSLSARWRMEDTDGTMADSSGKGNHGTSTGAVEVRRPGSTGYGYRFNGMPAYVTVPSSPELDPETSDFSITAHIRFTGLPPGGDINTFDVVRKGVTTTTGGDWKLEILMSGAAHCLFQGSAGKASAVGSRNLADDTWHKLTCSRTGNTVTLVVDGEARSATSATGTIRNASDVVLGVKNTSGFDQYPGYMDEVSITKG